MFISFLQLSLWQPREVVATFSVLPLAMAHWTRRYAQRIRRFWRRIANSLTRTLSKLHSLLLFSVMFALVRSYTCVVCEILGRRGVSRILISWEFPISRLISARVLWLSLDVVDAGLEGLIAWSAFTPRQSLNHSHRNHRHTHRE